MGIHAPHMIEELFRSTDYISTTAVYGRSIFMLCRSNHLLRSCE